MAQTFMERRRAQEAPAAQAMETGSPGPSIQELAAGARPSAEQMGHRVDLPDAVREKMESSFGADFSGVKLYESQTVADAGAEAMTMGSNVAFAPGKLDLTSTAGQALLGHELSHVVSQSRGESTGRGFLKDAHLEAQADRQGMMAAQGESVYQGPVTPVGASTTASASGPMQAVKKSTKAAMIADSWDRKLPSRAHPIERHRAVKEALNAGMYNPFYSAGSAASEGLDEFWLGPSDDTARPLNLDPTRLGKSQGSMRYDRDFKHLQKRKTTRYHRYKEEAGEDGKNYLVDSINNQRFDMEDLDEDDLMGARYRGEGVVHPPNKSARSRMNEKKFEDYLRNDVDFRFKHVDNTYRHRK